MNPQAFGILEFDQLRQLVRRHAQTDMGRARVAALEPFDDLEALRHALTEVGEAISLRARGGRFSFDGVADPSESIARLKIEGAGLDPLAMLDLVRLCTSALDARNAILAEREASPTLFEAVAALSPDLKKLATAITKKILPNGELDDRASPELARIRHDIGRLRSSITRSLENLMRRSSEAIQEELVTVRNDRFVIPVRADHRSRINGVAHGSSSSAQTIFIEPLQTIEANNELQTLREAEQREIATILFRLSEDLRAQLPAIEAAAEAVAVLDVINAKTAFGERFDCVVPEVWSAPAEQPGSPARQPRWGGRSGDGAMDESSGRAIKPTSKAVLALRSATALQISALELIDARHPLLEENLRASGGHVVPVSFTLDAEQTTMVISGANAGGKTVVLKTAGLLSLMALSGLPVPARSARVPFYRSVLADIGDHQSLAANLSTFTSHVANIATMIEICDGSALGSAGILPAASPSLVLLDEVGTGTDPEEGSALGVAVVDHFKQRGAHVLATTHYSGLKMYAANEPGVLNASVEFDERTLRPTYRLLVGTAGSSSGLDIAQRFGIPPDIIAGANEHVRQSSRAATEYLRRIKREADEAEALRRALEEERAAVAEKFATLDLDSQKRERERQTEFEKQSAVIFAEFEKLSRELLAQIQERADRVKVERETQKRAAELKREAQRAAKAMSEEARLQTRAQLRQSRTQDGGLPPQLRGVKVVRDGKVVGEGVPSPAQKPEETKREQDARAPNGDLAREIEVGDRVRLLSFGTTGIVDQIKDNEAEVRVGSLRMREQLSNLELLDGAASVRERGSSPTVREGSLESLRRRATATELHLHSKSQDSKFQTNELNLIGKTTDEAVDLADKFLDEAFLNGLSEVRIIHGHGTGALRKAVAEFLRGHPHVARFTSASPDKGGSGATQVELKS